MLQLDSWRKCFQSGDTESPYLSNGLFARYIHDGVYLVNKFANYTRPPVTPRLKGYVYSLSGVCF
jgi:hypothetical protein